MALVITMIVAVNTHTKHIWLQDRFNTYMQMLSVYCNHNTRTEDVLAYIEEVDQIHNVYASAYSIEYGSARLLTTRYPDITPTRIVSIEPFASNEILNTVLSNKEGMTSVSFEVINGKKIHEVLITDLYYKYINENTVILLATPYLADVVQLPASFTSLLSFISILLILCALFPIIALIFVDRRQSNART